MAKLIDLFTFSGRVGDIVGCQGPNGFYLRSRPRKSTKPPTQRQLENRARMALAADFLNPFREVIHLGFALPIDRRSKAGAFGRAMAHALRNAVEGIYPELYVNPEGIRLSKGALLALDSPSLSLEGAVLKVTWVSNCNRLNAFADDVVYVLTYHAEDGMLMTAKASRAAGELAIDISSEPSGSELLVYVCVAERGDKQFSNSQFLGTVVR